MQDLMNLDTYYNADRLNMMVKMANEFAKSQAFGADCKTPQAILVKMQAGIEMGMAPMEAMNSLYIINGHVTIYGMAMAKRIRESGWKIDYINETEKQVTVKVTKEDETHEYTATLEELNKLNSRAAKFAPKEKLRWHALGRILRFNIPEVMGGSVSYIKEEMEDIVVKEKPAVQKVFEVEEPQATPVDPETFEDILPDSPKISNIPANPNF